MEESDNLTASRPTMDWVPDETQQRVIDIMDGGYHLVLASPGCGKTQILTERIRRAHTAGTPYTDMLCLTFTNRAARGMRERIGQYIGGDDTAQLYVGNIHRFCSRYLFEQQLVPSESSVIDDDDAVSILARYLNEDESQVKASFDRRRSYAEIIQFAHFMHQVRQRHPRQLRLHPDCVSAADVAALRYICRVERRELTPEAMIDIYDHTDYYRDATRTDDYDVGIQQLIGQLLHKMRYAHAYTAYCRQSHLLDFEDLLLLTYDALASDPSHRRYPWIQVDEVQDLNAMQMAIIDLIASAGVAQGEGTVMYLGDSQQAIFSFMGAKASTLAMLHSRCEGHVYHLGVNHRSPRYLLQVFNEYASQVLRVPADLLPAPRNEAGEDTGGELRILTSDTIDGEYADVARFATELYRKHPDDTTAIIVSANRDADLLARELTALRTPFFKVSGTDIFSSPMVKVMLAHLSVLACETNFMAWARLLCGFGVFASPASSREFMRKLLNRAILPSDFLLYDGHDTYVQRFAHTIEADEVVVFDTETTGLDVAADDILQIAAVKLRKGRVVPGSAFVVHIATDRTIPEMLGDVANPIIEERRHQTLMGHADALRRFIDYIGDCPLVGHNVAFDYHILAANLRRYLPEAAIPDWARCYDTLLLLRLFHPDLPSYRLDYFRHSHLFGLSEDCAHLADVDVDDTCRVVDHLYGLCREQAPVQRDFLAQRSVASHVEVLRRQYRDLYLQAQSRLYLQTAQTDEPALVGEMRAVWHRLDSTMGSAADTAKTDYVLRYIASEVIDATAYPSLAEQLRRYVMDINTLKEADLCGSAVVTERIFVSTIHKAKGLEFDNVIVFDAVDGRYPNFYTKDSPEQCEEDKRKLYVALSRARRRLYLSWNMTRIDNRRQPQPRELSPYLNPILHHFDS